MNLYLCITEVCERYRIRTLQPLLVDGCSHLPLNAGACFLVMEEEIWRVIEESLGKYEVSNYGRVRNSSSKNILKETNTRNYRYVSMWFGNNRVRKSVHILVAKAFVDNPYCLPQVNHKDENPANNRSDNLEWCSASYNACYGSRNKKMLRTRKQRHTQTREKPVLQISPLGKHIAEYVSILEASRQTGIDYSNISKCCRDSCYNKSAGGYIWKYANESRNG